VKKPAAARNPARGGALGRLEELKTRWERDPASRAFLPLAEEYRRRLPAFDPRLQRTDRIERIRSSAATAVLRGSNFLHMAHFAESGWAACDRNRLCMQGGMRGARRCAPFLRSPCSARPSSAPSPASWANPCSIHQPCLASLFVLVRSFRCTPDFAGHPVPHPALSVHFRTSPILESAASHWRHYRQLFWDRHNWQPPVSALPQQTKQREESRGYSWL
jgi:hypothetical protein